MLDYLKKWADYEGYSDSIQTELKALSTKLAPKRGSRLASLAEGGARIIGICHRFLALWAARVLMLTNCAMIKN